jgi:hypothetical protein
LHRGLKARLSPPLSTDNQAPKTYTKMNTQKSQVPGLIFGCGME